MTSSTLGTEAAEKTSCFGYGTLDGPKACCDGYCVCFSTGLEPEQGNFFVDKKEDPSAELSWWNVMLGNRRLSSTTTKVGTKYDCVANRMTEELGVGSSSSCRTPAGEQGDAGFSSGRVSRIYSNGESSTLEDCGDDTLEDGEAVNTKNTLLVDGEELDRIVRGTLTSQSWAGQEHEGVEVFHLDPLMLPTSDKAGNQESFCTDEGVLVRSGRKPSSPKVELCVGCTDIASGRRVVDFMATLGECKGTVSSPIIPREVPEALQPTEHWPVGSNVDQGIPESFTPNCADNGIQARSVERWMSSLGLRPLIRQQASKGSTNPLVWEVKAESVKDPGVQPGIEETTSTQQFSGRTRTRSPICQGMCHPELGVSGRAEYSGYSGHVDLNFASTCPNLGSQSCGEPHIHMEPRESVRGECSSKVCGKWVHNARQTSPQGPEVRGCTAVSVSSRMGTDQYGIGSEAFGRREHFNPVSADTAPGLQPGYGELNSVGIGVGSASGESTPLCTLPVISNRIPFLDRPCKAGQPCKEEIRDSLVGSGHNRLCRVEAHDRAHTDPSGVNLQEASGQSALGNRDEFGVYEAESAISIQNMNLPNQASKGHSFPSLGHARDAGCEPSNTPLGFGVQAPHECSTESQATHVCGIQCFPFLAEGGPKSSVLSPSHAAGPRET